MTKKTAIKKDLPMVSVCTPTYNRRPFIQNMFECFRNQDYPKHRIEWIIVDDGTDKIRDLIEKSAIPQIRYFEVAEKMRLGAKRNLMHSHVRGSIIVYMDDDDYYPPDRISHAVDTLVKNPQALCAGSSEIYIYFKHIDKMYQCGPYGPNHATAGTFAFRKELLNQTKYDDNASLAEERAFLKDYTIPFVQLDPMKSILVFSHEHNTFDKRKMLVNMNPQFMKESPKTVDLFIKFKKEKTIKNFFMNDIIHLLKKYEPGEPKMKPDVLKQIVEIERERDKFIEEQTKLQQQNAGQHICLQRPGEEPKQLSIQEVVQLLQNQQNVINQLQQQLQHQEQQFMLGQLQQKTVSLPQPPQQDMAEIEKLILSLQNKILENNRQVENLSKIIEEKNQTIINQQHIIILHEQKAMDFEKMKIQMMAEQQEKQGQEQGQDEENQDKFVFPTVPPPLVFPSIVMSPKTPKTPKTKSEPEITILNISD